MAPLAGNTPGADPVVALARLATARAAENRLARVHAFLGDGLSEHLLPVLEAAHRRAGRIAAAAGENAASDAVATHVYAGDVLAGLAAEGELDRNDASITAGALAETCGVPLAVATFDLFLRAVASPVLLELPPLAAAEIQLRLLVDLDVVAEVSLWRRGQTNEPECIVSIGADPTDRQIRLEARGALRGREGIRLVGRSPYVTADVWGFGARRAAVVARVPGDPGRDSGAFLDTVALALSPLLEREQLLDRNAARERSLVGAAENRLTRIGFDLHDGPIQEVLVLGGETQQLRDDLYPFVLDSHRELAAGRFDDLIARLAEIDRQLRETAHSLESKSIVSRPLGEILHREIDAFTERTGIDGALTVHGDHESLGAQQRVALFRAIQESLSNVREHSGASSVDIRLRVRRSTVDVRIVDDGQGFEVNRSLALAAQRGRLGLVGIGERMSMLGGTFSVDSRPGGPTTLRFSLPRWEPFEPIGNVRG